MKVKEESEKVGLKLNIKKQRSWHPVLSLHGKEMGKQWKQWQTLFWGLPLFPPRHRHASHGPSVGCQPCSLQAEWGGPAPGDRLPAPFFTSWVSTASAHHPQMILAPCASFSFPCGSDSRVCLQCERPRFDPWMGKIPWRRKWQRTPVFLPGKSQGWRSLVG